MGINASKQIRKAKNLSDVVDKLNQAINKLLSDEEDLNSKWKAKEMQYVKVAFQKIEKEIRETNSKLSNLESKIIQVVHEIEREEAEEERRKKEAEQRAKDALAANKQII